MNKKQHIIDAKEKTLGRVATEVAIVLRGKNTPGFKPNIIPDVSVNIINSSKIKISGKKIQQKEYKRYSGYPGGLKIIKMKDMLDRKGMKHILEIAIRGMLPNNKLRKRMMKNLIIEN
ncbi:MAG: 50S ribosomal protein L13 [Patescibacteria group bacterium]